MDPLRHRRRRRSDAGVELIELAIVMPILVLLMIGVVDFAFLFQRWQVITNSAREGARLASLADDYQEQDVRDRVEDYVAASGLPGTPNVAVDFSSTEAIAGVSVNTVTVTVTYPSGFLFLPGSINLTSASEMRAEGGS
jgi:Flp pilus assembly protein TadG